MHNILRSHQLFVGHRGNLDGMLCQSEEEFSAGGRLSSVEAKSELIKVVVEVLGPHGSLMGSKHPALEQGNRPMDPREQMFARAAAALNFSMMDEPLHLPVGVESVSAYRASRLDGRANEPVKGSPVEIRNPGHTNTSDASAVLLSSYGDQGFGEGQPSLGSPSLGSPPSRFRTTSTTPQRRSRPGLTIACRSLWRISHAVL
ncbi:hypothetical protein BH09VER1_BH09VER1_53480 [soil metagenome]